VPLVVDTSVLIAVLTGEASRPALLRHTRQAELVAPASVHWEVGNACSALLKRRKATPAQIRRILAAYARIPIRFVEVELEPALALAAEHGLYAYDAYLLACAQNQRAPLLTLDRGLARVAAATGIAVEEIKP
jgi:predicted nucleic acid-binding protein